MKPVLIACLTAFGLIAVAPVYTASSKREPPIADGGDYVGNTQQTADGGDYVGNTQQTADGGDFATNSGAG